jgi:putative ABC transport system permease protein
MWLISRSDLVFRRRRFVIAVLVTALVFGMALLFDGMKRAVQNEVPRTVEMFGADAWIVPEGVTGPFTTTAVFPSSVADDLADDSRVRGASPVVLSRAVARVDPDKDANVIGSVRGAIPDLPIDEGREVRARGEAVVDEGLGLSVGDELPLGSETFEIVGIGDRLRYNFGAPTVLLTLRDAQALTFEGSDLVMAVPVQGEVSSLPAGFIALTNDDVVEDLKRITKPGVQTIDLVSVLLWIVAIGIIGSVVYLNALERTRDFAVLKATGSPNRTIVGGLAIQSLFLSIIAAVLAIGVAWLVGLALPFPAELEAASYGQMFGIAIVVGLLASFIGARRALTTDPALAFGAA